MGKPLTTEEFIQKAKKIHGDKYDYSRSSYQGGKLKIEIICKIHGSFSQIASNHLNGCGCPICKNIVSNPEIEVQDFVKSLGLKIKTNDRKFLENGQELDIIIHSKKLAIEFNGIYWHYDTKNSKGKVRGYHSNKSKICKSKNYVLYGRA